MARTLNAATHAVRRDEILDVAEGLIRTRGYDGMSIQDVQDALGASRGAIYHYFRSKEAILEAVIERMTSAIVPVMEPIAADPTMRAVDKLGAVFAAAGAWKAQRSDLLLALIRSWLAPGNDLVRFRANTAGMAAMTPMLEAIIAQGAYEGDFQIESPADTASVLIALLTGSADALRVLVLEALDGHITLEQVERRMAAYDQAVERILGLTPGSFTFIDRSGLQTWFS
jgi:AcrR family transcriptional regulator